VLGASTPYEFSAGPIVARTDVRWFSTLPAEVEGAPLLELRRWPGDSVLAIYGLQASGAPSAPAWPSASWSALANTGPADVGVWDGTLDTPAGPRPAMWIVRRVAEDRPWLAALLLPGDAGLGQPGTEAIAEEMLGILRRLEIRDAAWKALPAIPPATIPAIPLTVEAPGAMSETDSPWQVARAAGFTIGLPPGIRARPMGADVPAPRHVPGGRLWLRGRFGDAAGDAVVIGDAERFGYVARIEPARAEEGEEPHPPLAAPGASRLAAEPFPLAAERTGALRATVERWSEPAFTGQWLVFRLRFADHEYEIALPVVEGRRSPALFWIAATWRDDRKPPAPPPVDPAERFGIRFERLGRGDRQKQPWLEGYLRAPGLALEVSRGWFPAASLRSDNGYPVRFLTEEGRTVGVLVRVQPEAVGRSIGEIEGLVEEEKPGRHRASRVVHDGEDNYLFVAPGDGHGFLFEFSPPSGASAKEIGEWRELWRLMVRSVRLDG
jgi:hypothetical protein